MQKRLDRRAKQQQYQEAQQQEAQKVEIVVEQREAPAPLLEEAPSPYVVNANEPPQQAAPPTFVPPPAPSIDRQQIEGLQQSFKQDLHGMKSALVQQDQNFNNQFNQLIDLSRKQETERASAQNELTELRKQIELQRHDQLQS